MGSSITIIVEVFKIVERLHNNAIDITYLNDMELQLHIASYRIISC